MVMSREQVAEAAWEALIEEQAESAPGTYLQEGEVLGRGMDPENDPAPMRVNSLRYKGYVEVWDTLTGVKSLQPWWLLWQTMRKRREDGSLVFTRVNPHIPQDYGDDLYCPLNPAAPPEVRFEGKGFKSCKKQHIPHWDGLERHVKKSHRRAWEAIERDRRDRERQEDRDLQRAAIRTQQEFISRLMERETAPPAMPVTPVTVEPTAKAPAAPPQQEVETFALTCELCGWEATGNGRLAVHNRMKAHRRTVHPAAPDTTT